MPTVRATGVKRWWGLHPVWVRVVPFAIYLAFLAATLALPAMDGRWIYPVRVGVVAAALIFLWKNFEELSVARLSSRDCLWAIAAGIAVFFLWINLDISWTSLVAGDKSGGFDPRLADGRIDWLLAALRLAGAALVVPVMEELFWRSLVMRWFDYPAFLEREPRSVSLSALLASSVAFGFEHNLWLAGIVAGLAYGEIYRRSGNLWAPILAHSVTNGMLGFWVLWSGRWQYW